MSLLEPNGTGWRDSLSVKLLALTIGAILLIELIIFVPSAVSRRDAWLSERTQAARIAALALEAAPSQRVSEELAQQLLDNAEVVTVAELGGGIRQLLLAPDTPVSTPMRSVDLTASGDSYLRRLGHTVGTIFSPEDLTLRILDESNEEGFIIEVLVPERPLRQDLNGFSHRVILLSLLIAIFAGSLVYLVLLRLVVDPMRSVTESILRFSRDPSKISPPKDRSSRRDEIGLAQNALSDMEQVVSDAFRERQRLARLGQAVAKINHDLRNSLAAAQLVSDSLSMSDDPRVKKAAPRLERALERAINLTQNTLQYGKAETPKPIFRTINLHDAVEEAAAEALAGRDSLAWENKVPPNDTAEVDPDHIHRIVSNLLRNAGQATLEARPEGGCVCVERCSEGLRLIDNGPGLPRKARENLFKAFSGSVAEGGTGLGLTIARDLARVMGGDVKLEETGPDGTTFLIALPS
ncbi:MAG: HAMP domain-containing sensor histidine kinase [Pseudomonadota bacterium]